MSNACHKAICAGQTRGKKEAKVEGKARRPAVPLVVLARLRYTENIYSLPKRGHGIV
jgi:hypothetical protein